MREQIIRATAKIISKKGPKAASIRAICSSVGITAPTLYYYFEDRTELLSAVTLMAFNKNSKFKLVDIKKEDPINLISQTWDDYIEFATNEPELYSVMMSSQTIGQIPECGRKCFEATIQKFELAEQKELLTIDALEAAFIYQAAAQGVAILIIGGLNIELAKNISKKMKNFILAGLLRRAPLSKIQNR